MNDEDDDSSSGGVAIEMASRTRTSTSTKQKYYGHSALATAEDDFVDEHEDADDTNEDEDGVFLEAREPMAWADSQMRRQNRCFFFALAAMILGAGVFVVLNSFEGEGAVLEGDKYNAETGILNEEFEGAKEQENYENEHGDGDGAGGIKNAHDWFASHGKDNPFGNENAVEHGNGQSLSKLRWEKNHPGQPFPGDNKKGGNSRHPGSMDKAGIGSMGGHPGGAGGEGGRPTGGGAGGPGGKPMGGLRPGGGNGRPNGNKHNPGRPNTAGGGAASQPTAGGQDGAAGGQGRSLQCDHSVYADWLDATVTFQDGIKYEVVEKFNHDRKAFVQGLTYADGTLWESNGLYGKSTVRILDPDTADVIKSVDMPAEVFGEGMAYWEDKLYQITWKSRQGFIYNATTLEVVDRFEFHTTNDQGWGITWDPCEEEFIVTDGSPNLHFWEKNTLAEKRKVAVTRIGGDPAKDLNEVEWYRGKILANVWFEDVLLVIDPVTGTVEKEYDFSHLFPKTERRKIGCDVFNGISVSADPDILYVTGKKWDRMFKVRLLS